MNVDPFDTSDPLYECYDCGYRVETGSYRGNCPECNGTVKNISVSRE